MSLSIIFILVIPECISVVMRPLCLVESHIRYAAAMQVRSNFYANIEEKK